MNVRVIPCKFEVTTIGEWRVPGEANIYIAATSGDAEVKAADAQGPFTGSTTVNWVFSADRVGDCVATITIGSSRVDWTGAMDDSGQLTLNSADQPAAGSINSVCTADGTHFGTDGSVGTDSTQVQLTPDPLQVSVASSGGVFKQSQVLQWDGANPGYVTIIVVPEEDEAVAFNADSRAALSPSAWWAMLWDDFPWSYGALLALH